MLKEYEGKSLKERVSLYINGDGNNMLNYLTEKEIFITGVTSIGSTIAVGALIFACGKKHGTNKAARGIVNSLCKATEQGSTMMIVSRPKFRLRKKIYVVKTDWIDIYKK